MKKTLQTNIAMNDSIDTKLCCTCMTLDCVRSTQFSVVQTIHCNVGLKCFF